MNMMDTVPLMGSDDYKERFIAEYVQVSIRLSNLKTMLHKWGRGELDFEPSCPKYILEQQETGMQIYKGIMETRAEYERINLPEVDFT